MFFRIKKKQIVYVDVPGAAPIGATGVSEHVD
jgi:hypothetical protein